MEIVRTKSSTYVGTILTDSATSVDEYDNDVPCIILEPVADKGVEVWLPVESIVSRNVVLYAD